MRQATHPWALVKGLYQRAQLNAMAEETKPKTKLHEWLVRHQHKQAWLASYLGIKRQSVNAWVMGKTRPDPEYAYAIVDLAGGELKLEDLLPRVAGAKGSRAPATKVQTLQSHQAQAA